MKYKKHAIPVHELAAIIDVSNKTLISWLCHYSLAKYSYRVYMSNGYYVNMFAVTNRSLQALKNYLSKKRIKYLDFLESGLDKIKKYK